MCPYNGGATSRYNFSHQHAILVDQNSAAVTAPITVKHHFDGDNIIVLTADRADVVFSVVVTQRFALDGIADTADLGILTVRRDPTVTQRFALGFAAAITGLGVLAVRSVPAMIQRLALDFATNSAGLGGITICVDPVAFMHTRSTDEHIATRDLGCTISR